MENREIDGLMERIEYAVSVCEKNGHLSYDQHKDFNDACARLRVHSEEANDYVVASIIKVQDIMKSTFNTRHRTLNTSLRKMGY